ncbi:MAG: hypothetical protein PHU85_09475 [Phycisphaerae bacterium]|nr:hypothetical protein [Phycisphaerae bacterium]
MKMLSVTLSKKWSGHKAGETVTVEDYTAESMVRKGYGEIVKPTPRQKPAAETTMAMPAAETADNPPDPEAVDHPKAEAKPAARTWRKRKDGD